MKTCHKSALRANIARGINPSDPTDPTHWTRLQRPGSWFSSLPSD